MENYLELSRALATGLYGGWEQSALILSGLLLCTLIVPFRGVSFAAVLVVAIAVALLYAQTPVAPVTVLLIGSGIVFAGWEHQNQRSRLRRMERRLAAMSAAVRGLQIAEERRQAYGARKSVPLLPDLSEKRKAGDKDLAPAMAMAGDGASPLPGKLNGTAAHP